VAITAPEARANSQRSARINGQATTPTRRRRSIAERLTLNVVVGVVAALLAFVLAATLLRDRREMVTIAVATEAIPAGVGHHSCDDRPVGGPSRDDIRRVAHLVRRSRVRAARGVSDTAGRRAAHGLRRGVGDCGTSGQRVMSIPLEVWQAANGDIEVGDQVDVIEAGREGAARYVLTGASVVGRSGSEGRAVSSATHVREIS
jgi:hypothetical protein